MVTTSKFWVWVKWCCYRLPQQQCNRVSIVICSDFELLFQDFFKFEDFLHEQQNRYLKKKIYQFIL